MAVDHNEQIKGLKKALGLWQKKRALFEEELVLNSNAVYKFELRERISECQQEIERITGEITDLQQESSVENSETIDDAMRRVLSRHRSPEETRDAVITSLRYLIEQPELQEDTVKFVLDTAINNLNENDGSTSKPNTLMDKAFYKVLYSSNFSELCYQRLLQGYINAKGKRRTAIAIIIIYKLETKVKDLTTDNAGQILNPLLNKLIDHSLDAPQRVEAGLKLVESFFRPQIYIYSGKKDFIPQDILSPIINALFYVLDQEVKSQDENAIVHTAIWALGWLTSARYCYFYPHREKISASQYNTLRRVVADKKQDSFTRSWGALILSVCAAKTHLFTQESWIKGWAELADSGKSKLPNINNSSHLKGSIDSNITVIKNLVEAEEVPIEVKKNAAIALGRLEYFCSEMVKPLLYAFRNKTLPSDERDESLVYLVAIGDSQVVSALREGMEAKNSTDGYDLRWRCFLALNSMGDHNARQKHRFFSKNEDKFLAQQGHQIHKLKAKDSTGRWAYYFVYVESRNEQAFLDALESNQSIDLENFGEVVGSCYGEQPNDELRALLRNKYGFDV